MVQIEKKATKTLTGRARPRGLNLIVADADSADEADEIERFAERYHIGGGFMNRLKQRNKLRWIGNECPFLGPAIVAFVMIIVVPFGMSLVYSFFYFLERCGFPGDL